MAPAAARHNRMAVRKPATRPRWVRSKPIRPPASRAASRRSAISVPLTVTLMRGRAFPVAPWFLQNRPMRKLIAGILVEPGCLEKAEIGLASVQSQEPAHERPAYRHA